jgi:hypothetical protein
MAAGWEGRLTPGGLRTRRLAFLFGGYPLLSPIDLSRMMPTVTSWIAATIGASSAARSSGIGATGLRRQAQSVEAAPTTTCGGFGCSHGTSRAVTRPAQQVPFALCAIVCAMVRRRQEGGHSRQTAPGNEGLDMPRIPLRERDSAQSAEGRDLNPRRT